MIIRKLYIFPFLFTLSICAMDQNRNQSLIVPSVHNEYYDQRQEHKNVHFVQMPDDCDKSYSERMVNAIKKGPMRVLEEVSARVVLEGLENLKERVLPNPEQMVNESIGLSSFTKKSIEWSHELLEICDNAISGLPDGIEKKIYLGYYHELEEQLLSTDYYNRQSKLLLCKKVSKLNNIITIYEPNISIIIKKFGNSKTKADKEDYFRKYQEVIGNILKDLHETVYLEEDNDKLKNYARDGALIATGGVVATGGYYCYNNPDILKSLILKFISR